MSGGSALYTGRLRHRRRRPRRHEFSYGVHQVLLDLDDLPRLDRTVAGFGHNRAAVTSFHDVDHLGALDRPLRAKLDDWLRANGVEPPGGPVTLLTNLRVLGYVFNPVSWFFVHDRDGALALVVAEVNNTFGDAYAYILDDLRPAQGGMLAAGRTKRFHVSPFLPIDGHRYEFRVRPPGDRLLVHMDVLDDTGKVFDATLALRRGPLTTRRLWAALARRPLLPLRTIVLIHWNALRLWARRVPFHRRPDPPDPGYPSPDSPAPRRRRPAPRRPDPDAPPPGREPAIDRPDDLLETVP